MPGKLFYFVSILIALVLFIGFNLNNHCDISVIFYVFKDVPIFLSILFAFILGNIAVVPFLFGRQKKKVPRTAVYPQVEEVKLKKEKWSWFGKKKKTKQAPSENSTPKNS